MRQIKAQDVKPGMEIEWKHGGYYTRCVVGLVEKENLSYPAYSIRAVGSSAGWKIFSEGDEVTVLKEAQPPEPTAFGACVEAGGVKYVRCDDDDLKWKSSDGTGWWGWSDFCDKGHVTVVNADPFASTGQREPRVWDRWEDVPDMTAVHGAGFEGEEPLYHRKNRNHIEKMFSNGDWMPSVLNHRALDSEGPWTAVRGA